MSEREYMMARALVAALLPPGETTELVLGSMDAWQARVQEAIEAAARADASVAENLTVKQVAKWLNVNPSQVYRLIAAGELPERRVGKAIRVPSHAVQAFIEANETYHAKPEPRPRGLMRRAKDRETIAKHPWLATG